MTTSYFPFFENNLLFEKLFLFEARFVNNKDFDDTYGHGISPYRDKAKIKAIFELLERYIIYKEKIKGIGGFGCATSFTKAFYHAFLEYWERVSLYIEGWKRLKIDRYNEEPFFQYLASYIDDTSTIEIYQQRILFIFYIVLVFIKDKENRVTAIGNSSHVFFSRALVKALLEVIAQSYQIKYWGRCLYYTERLN
jgi:ribosomal protein S12 methylthiotransferase accessory factor YcaO